MKRPEGFDPGASGPAPEQAARSTERPESARGRRTPAKPAIPAKSERAAVGGSPARDSAGGDPATTRTEKQARPPKRPKPRRELSPARLAQREARRAARERRSFERSEVRRFTRRTRHRRAAWFTAGGVVVVLGALIAVAVYSPLLALERIEIAGTSRLQPEEIHDAVDGQLGTPLALVDFDDLKKELAGFSLIRSYVTEAVPPHTLIIHISEREPVGSLMTAGGYTLVDPAGVEVEETDTRPDGVPIIDTPDADDQGPVFEAVVEVLLALPDPVLAQVDSVSATTMDDVTLVFTGVGQRVVWGSADRSELKARVLEKLMALQDAGALVEYDVTAPLSAVVRPG